MGVNLQSEDNWLNENRDSTFKEAKGNYSIVIHDAPASSINEHIQKSGRVGRNPRELADDVTFVEPYMTMRQVIMYCGDPATIEQYRTQLRNTL